MVLMYVYSPETFDEISEELSKDKAAAAAAIVPPSKRKVLGKCSSVLAELRTSVYAMCCFC